MNINECFDSEYENLLSMTKRFLKNNNKYLYKGIESDIVNDVYFLLIDKKSILSNPFIYIWNAIRNQIIWKSTEISKTYFNSTYIEGEIEMIDEEYEEEKEIDIESEYQLLINKIKLNIINSNKKKTIRKILDTTIIDLYFITPYTLNQVSEKINISENKLNGMIDYILKQNLTRSDIEFVKKYKRFIKSK